MALFGWRSASSAASLAATMASAALLRSTAASVVSSSTSLSSSSRRLFHAGGVANFDNDRNRKTLRQLVLMRPVQTAGGIFYPMETTSPRSATLEDLQADSKKDLFVPTTCGLLYRVEGKVASSMLQQHRELVEVLDCKNVPSSVSLIHGEAMVNGNHVVVVDNDDDDDDDVHGDVHLRMDADDADDDADDEPSLAELLQASSSLTSRKTDASGRNIDGDLAAEKMMMTNVLKKRRRKMNRHKYKKWRRRMRFKLRALR